MNTDNLTSCGPKGQVTVNSSLGVEGFVDCSVVDSKTGEVIRSYPRQHNLILNYGLNYWCTTHSLINGIGVAVVGTGTTVTGMDSSPTTAAQSGTTVNLSGGSLLFTDTSTDAGRMIKWDTGEEAMIITVSSTTQATVTPSQSVSAGDFNYYYTNQAGLATEVKRTNTYLSSAGANGTTGPSMTGATATITMWHTYDFSAETVVRSYTELGFSSSLSAGNNLWSRIKLASPVALEVAQQLRVKYTINCILSPITSTAVDTSVITGWTGAVGDYMPIKFAIATTATENGSSQPFDPAGNMFVILSDWVPTWPPTFNLLPAPVDNSVPSIYGNYTSLLTYTTNSFYRDKTITFPVESGNSNAIRSIVIGYTSYYGAQYSGVHWIFLMDSAQTKDNTHTLTLTFRVSVGRVLA